MAPPHGSVCPALGPSADDFESLAISVSDSSIPGSRHSRLGDGLGCPSPNREYRDGSREIARCFVRGRHAHKEPPAGPDGDRRAFCVRRTTPTSGPSPH